jgi:hypothetical protein
VRKLFIPRKGFPPLIYPIWSQTSCGCRDHRAVFRVMDTHPRAPGFEALISSRKLAHSSRGQPIHHNRRDGLHRTREYCFWFDSVNKVGRRSDTGDGKSGREGRVCAVHSSTTRPNFRVCGSRLLARVTSPVTKCG